MTESRVGKGNILKVTQLGLENDVFNAMKQPNFSVEALTRKFKSDGVNITSQSIRKFIRKSKKAQQQLIQSDMRTAHQLTKTMMDYNKEMKEILNEVKEVKAMAKDEKDMTTYNQMVNNLMKGLELIAKLTGDMRPKGSVDINIIYNEINANVEKEMKTIKKEMFKEAAIDIDYEIKTEDELFASRIREGEKE